MSECWCCANPDATQEDWLRHVQSIVDEHGWMVQHVNGTRVHAPFAYTVGLTPHGLAELVVTGKQATPSAELLNAAAQHVLASSAIQPGETLHLDGVHLEAVALPHPDAHLFTALDMYGPQVRGLQLVWADGRGRMPWERGHRGGRGGQPVLGPRSEAAR